MEIIKKVSNVMSLIRFSSEFIKGYGARHTHPHSLILSYKPVFRDDLRHICIVDDDIETFTVQKHELAPAVIVSSLLKQYRVSKAVDRFIYWVAHENTFTDDGESTTNHMVVSFDLITKEFKVVDEALCCGVWVMENDSSFRKLFTIGAPANKVLGFRKNGEPIFEIGKESPPFTTLDVYDPCSQQMKNLRISGVEGSFFMGSYKESLLLLDHLDSHIYYDNDNTDQNDDDHISSGPFCS
nr:hypothetical protein [Tanacetum cinerariifolium]